MQVKYLQIVHLTLQLWDQDIAPLKRSLSSNSRRLSRISQLALVISDCFFFFFLLKSCDFFLFIYFFFISYIWYYDLQTLHNLIILSLLQLLEFHFAWPFAEYDTALFDINILVLINWCINFIWDTLNTNFLFCVYNTFQLFFDKFY